MLLDHHYYKEKRNLHYSFIEECVQKEKPSYIVHSPTIVFHGSKDEQVPLEISKTYLESQSTCELLVYDSDHRMHDKLDEIWEVIEKKIIL